MKRNIFAVGMLLAFSAALWSCSSSDDKTPDLDQVLDKETVATEAASLAAAVEEITSSPGFELITMSESGSSVKEGTEEDGSDERFSLAQSITLEDIKGVYDYILPAKDEESNTKMGYGFWHNAFDRVDDSEFFEINLPQEKAERPWKLYVEEDDDAELENNFHIKASEYNSSTETNNDGIKFDYMLNADLSIEEEDAGNIIVDWTLDMPGFKMSDEEMLDDEMPGSGMTWTYMSEFGLDNGYSVGHDFILGETVEFAYNLKKDEEVLFMEEVKFNRGSEEDYDADYEYALTIGNIKIVKKSSSDEYEVYRDGQLEEDAVIEILEEEDDATKNDEDEGEFDEDESEDAFCRGGFDIKITFTNDDGTEDVVILSELLGEDTLNDLDEIFSSMYDMYFVKNLVDRVAREAYRENTQQNFGE
ncbi:hypothetical protein [Marinifilum sp.]|uniref:hypothetical protein n=1 Tax=Marinifilum sp. TaxID=2033137 RepID=UPI003BAD46F4